MESGDAVKADDVELTPEPANGAVAELVEAEIVVPELPDAPELTPEQLRARDAFNDLLFAVPEPDRTEPARASETDPGALQDRGDDVQAVSPVLAPSAVELTVAATPAFDFSERPRRVRPHTGRLDWIALALAFVVPPVGLIGSVVLRILSYRKHGWTSGVTRIATVIGVILTAVLAVVITVNGNIAEANLAQAKKVSASVPLCWELQTTPGILDQPAFGWPIERTALPDTLIAMKDYQARWSLLADKAPSFEKAAVRSIADAATTVVNEVESSRSIDRTANLDRMTMITVQSALPQWFATYCK
jgi:hypothetical protein